MKLFRRRIDGFSTPANDRPSLVFNGEYSFDNPPAPFFNFRGEHHLSFRVFETGKYTYFGKSKDTEQM